MKTFVAVSLVSIAFAAPALVEKRQDCSSAFVWARGSMEPAPLGPIIGTRLEAALKKKIPNLKTFPVGYAASLLTNLSEQRTDKASIDKGVEAFEKAHSTCPNAKIIAGGYSQGAAVMHNTIGKYLKAEIKNKIVGVALFGDTRNKQDNGHIPNFPSDRSRVWCNPSDGVCGGGLNVNAGHLAYDDKSINEAADWLVAKLNGSGGGGAVESSSESSPSSSSGGKGKSMGTGGKGMGGKGMGGKGMGGKGMGGKGMGGKSSGGSETATESASAPTMTSEMEGHSHGSDSMKR